MPPTPLPPFAKPKRPANQHVFVERGIGGGGGWGGGGRGRRVLTGKSTSGGSEVASDFVTQHVGVVEDDKVGVQGVTALRHVTRVCTHSARETNVSHITA